MRPRETKIGTEVGLGHVTRDSDTTFKVKGSKVNGQGRGHSVAASLQHVSLTFLLRLMESYAYYVPAARIDVDVDVQEIRAQTINCLYARS